DISLSHVEVLGPELSRPPTSEFPALGGAAPPRRRLWGNQPAPGPAITFDEADKAAVSNALGLMSKDRANATAVAIAAQYPNTNWRSVGAVPFSSARKWASVTAISDDGAAHGTWVLGAPEMVFPVPATAAQQEARLRADQVAESGSRVLVLARAATEPTSTGTPPGQPVGGGKPDVALPTGLEPMAIVELTERIREDAPATLKFFTEQGVALKVISGDNPRTVGAVAARVGVPGVRGAEDAIDARTLPESLPELARVLENNSVFGRVTPAQKRAIVAALQSENHVVAMTGDGVNDALALKDADIGVAMGSGSPATRAVAQLVLLDGKFSHLPAVVAEGRRVIANIERAANLFLIKNAYALVLAVVTAITASAYPFEPIQLTLISALTIGIPGFFLALGPNRRRYVPGFMKRVLKFAIPTGVVVAAAAYASFRAIHLLEPAASAADGRTTATLSTLVVCLWVVVTLARPINGWKVVLVSGLGVLAIAAVLVPWVATGIFFLTVTWQRALVGVAIGAVAAGLVEILYRLVGVHKIRDESVVTIRASLENQRQFIEERRQETQTTDIIPRVGATRRIARAQVAGPRYQSLTEYAESQPNFPVSEVEDINRGRWNT
ncbi:MAG: HAD-IC family P-type ATPase, partial [Promicromonosporaceae bacterium]|nr:HAD-IC family P-type ATPase [Promicromonosporaceae bacterium]